MFINHFWSHFPVVIHKHKTTGKKRHRTTSPVSWIFPLFSSGSTPPMPPRSVQWFDQQNAGGKPETMGKNHDVTKTTWLHKHKWWFNPPQWIKMKICRYATHMRDTVAWMLRKLSHQLLILHTVPPKTRVALSAWILPFYHILSLWFSHEISANLPVKG
jgi:hypothetical protein